MKKALLSPILALLLVTACEKEKITTDISAANQPAKVETKQDFNAVPPSSAGASVEDRSSNKVTICHVNGQGEFHAIEVNKNAVAAHLAHGDYLPDADGDGYTAVGACTGSQDDCDDTNAAINPGAEEVTGNGLDDDCDPNTPDGCPEIAGLLLVTLPDGSCMYVHPTDNGNIQWGGSGTDIPELDNLSVAEALADFDGAGNTQKIVNALGANGGTAYAAKLCADLNAYGYQDWYLPAYGELYATFQQLGPAGSNQITTGFYWSSSEYSAIFAYGKRFSDPLNSINPKGSNYPCRCVRRQ